MAKDKPKGGTPANPSDLPDSLARVMESARAGAVPYPSIEEESMVPELFKWLTPMIVTDPRYKGEGKPPKALREPLLMISWDRRSGVWKASISDKVLNLSGSAGLKSLATALVDVEEHLRSGTFVWGQRKVT